MHSNRPIFRLLAGALALALAAVTPQSASAAGAPLSPEAQVMRSAAKQAGIPDAYLPLETPAQARAGKATRPAWERKLTSIVRDRLRTMDLAGVMAGGKLAAGAGPQAARFSTPELLIDGEGRVRVELKVDNDESYDDAFFAARGGQVVAHAYGYGYIVVWLPIDQIESVAGLPDVRQVMHIDPPYTDVGSQQTEGDAIHQAAAARTSFGITGTGVTVGVISDGVDNIAAAQGTGDLPAGVTVSCAGSGDEGTAMLEIVNDLAPGANLAFCSGQPGTASMINAINTLAAIAGMDIITDDLPMPGEPLFEDGPIAQAKQAAFGAGIFYTASSGNRGNQHYEGFFNSTATNVTIGPNTYANPHDFGGGDYRLAVTLGSPNSNANSLYLQWADQFGASGNDFDLYVVDNAGNVLASSTNTQSGSQNPNEVVSFNAANGTQAHIIVDYVGGGAAPAVFFDLRGFSGFSNWEYLVRAGSVNGASRQSEVYAAGAAFQGTPNTLQSSSSRGPARHFFPAQLTRMKPDGVCVDGVSVTGVGGFGAGTCPAVNAGDCQFFGTSASTPHVAGLAALLLEVEPTLTPGQVAGAFNATAIDMDTPGPDNNAGNGRLDVFAAICMFDDTPPTIICPSDVTVECTGNGGIDADDPQLTAFFGGAVATDICDSNVQITNDAPAFIPVGTLTITFTATDDQGNQNTCTADITVEDTQPPTITCPSDLTFECDSIGDFGTPTATDQCDPDPAITLLSRDSLPGDCPQEYTLTLTYEAMDFEGNADTCQQVITVEDTTPPVITCPDTVHIDFSSPTEAELTFTVTATDNCNDSPTITCDSVSGSVWQIGYHEVSCVADDGCGNTDSCSFRFLLVPLDIKPTSCPNPLNLKAQGGGKNAEYDLRSLIQPAGSTPDEAVVPVAILGTAEIDVTDIDPTTVTLAGIKPLRWDLADVAAPVAAGLADSCACSTAGPDGFVDLIFKFDRQALIDALGSLEDGQLIMIQIAGYTTDSIQFAGGDCMLIRGQKGPSIASAGDGGDDVSLGSYPNPFNAATTVTYYLPQDGHVSLEVFNILGQKVATLVNGDQPAGRHDMVWTGRTSGGDAVASGVYFFRLQTGGSVLTRKMMLLK